MTQRERSPVMTPDRAADFVGPAEAALAAVLRDHDIGILEAVPRSRLGEFRITPAVPMTGRTGPAREYVERLSESFSRLGVIEATVPIPPRVYLRTRLEFLRDAVLSAVERDGEHFGWAREHTAEPVLITVTDPNAEGPLHLGHLRNLFLGAALAQLHRARGHDTTTQGLLSHGAAGEDFNVVLVGSERVVHGMVRVRGGATRARQGHAVTANAVIHQLTEQVRARALPPDQVSGGTARLDDGAIAVATLKHALLRLPRAKSVDVNVAAVLGRSLPAVIEFLQWADPPDGAVGAPPEDPAAAPPDPHRAATRAVLMAINELPRALQIATDRRDPSVVLTHLDQLTSDCRKLRAHGRTDQRLRVAVAVAVRSGLDALDLFSHVPTRTVAA